MKTVMTLGDPHLGRKFRTGVPLHRIGDREAMVWAQFAEELFDPGAEIHVCMGDLFDKFVVAPEIVIRAANVYLEAARRDPDTMFVILEGNHDVSRDTAKASSFDLFTMLVADADNIMVVREDPWVYENLGFVPYHPFKPTTSLVEELPDNLSAVYGHWDIQDWGGDNVIPTKLLAEMGITQAISGHDHVGRIEERDGVVITVTGSMQPYTHAEDRTGLFYRTLELADLEGLETENLNLRVLLREGESLPTDIDCLSITARRITDEDEKLEVDTSEFESLSLDDMLGKALEGLSIKDELMEAFRNDQ